MRCVDIGCGGGAVTLEIARLIAPDGVVVGVDMDEVKVSLARWSAAEAGLDNAEFRVLDVTDWDEPGSYDAVYSRFLFQHLREPAALIDRMWAAVRDGGVLIAEGADFDGWCGWSSRCTRARPGCWRGQRWKRPPPPSLRKKSRPRTR